MPCRTGGHEFVPAQPIVRGQHPPGDIVGHLRDDFDLMRRADALGFDGIVKGSHYGGHPFECVQQVPFLAYAAAIAPRLRLICGLVLLPLHKPLDLAKQMIRLNRRLGVNHIVASVHWPGMPNTLALDQLQILAEEVMPQVRQAI